MTIIEFVIYAVISIDVYWQNKSMTGKLSNDTLRRRHRGNVISFTGQMIISFLAIFGGGFAVVLINAVTRDKYILQILTIVIPAFYSMAQFVSSNELQRHVKSLIWPIVNIR